MGVIVVGNMLDETTNVTTIMVIVAHRRSFSLIFDPEVRGHLCAIEAKYHSLIRTTIEEQLSFEPETQTRNRKPLQRLAASGAIWELRFSPDNRFRVLYELDLDRQEVRILAIGVKQRDRLIIAGEEVEL